MADHQHTGYGSKFLKWMLILPLLYSFFTFAGGTSCVQSQQNHTVNTQWVISHNSRIRQPISLKRATTLFAKRALVSIFSNSTSFFIPQYHSLLVKIELIHLSTQFIPKNQLWGFPRLKILCPRSKEPFSLA